MNSKISRRCIGLDRCTAKANQIRGLVAEYVISMEEKAISLIDAIERGHAAPAGPTSTGQ